MVVCRLEKIRKISRWEYSDRFDCLPFKKMWICYLFKSIDGENFASSNESITLHQKKKIAMIDISKQTISINCPECKRSITVSLKQVADEVTVRRNCGQGIKLTDNNGSAKKSIRDINKSFKDLENTFNNFWRWNFNEIISAYFVQVHFNSNTHCVPDLVGNVIHQFFVIGNIHHIAAIISTTSNISPPLAFAKPQTYFRYSSRQELLYSMFWDSDILRFFWIV